MRKAISSIFVCLLLAVFFTGCETQADKIKKSVIYDAELIGIPTAVIPGQMYRVSVNLVTDQGLIENVSLKSLVTTSKSGIIKEESFIPDLNTLKFIEGRQHYDLHIKVPINPAYPGKTFTFGVDWNRFDRLNFSGDDGLAGRKGLKGSNAFFSINYSYETGEPEIDGYSITEAGAGQDGGHGTNGGSGPLLNFTLLSVKLNDTAGLPFSDAVVIYEKKRLILLKKQEIVIDISGGDGGSGGSGGKGGSSAMASEKLADKYGQMTLLAGSGGDGGEATLIVSDNDNLKNYLTVRVGGGRGGRGGDAGGAGAGVWGAFSSLDSGRDGRDGRHGQNGSYDFHETDQAQVEQTIKKELGDLESHFTF